jgi:hypothetical protein
MIKAMIVGENSRIIDCLGMRPTVSSGRKGLSIFDAVCKAITAPINTDMSATIPRELNPIPSTS